MIPPTCMVCAHEIGDRCFHPDTVCRCGVPEIIPAAKEAPDWCPLRQFASQSQGPVIESDRGR